MRISDWSSDVCSSDLLDPNRGPDEDRDGERGGASDPRYFGRDRERDLQRQLGRPEHRGYEPRGWRGRPRPVGRERRARYQVLARQRSEARRVGKECGSTCSSRGAPDNKKKKKK